MSSLSHIPTDFGKGWMYSRLHNTRGIFVPLDFIRMNDGNLHDALLFAQIMYWHEPNSDGKPKLTILDDGHYWLAKNHSDWMDECCINRATARVALKRLEQRGLIVYKVGGFAGNPTPLMRINWAGFEQRYKALMATNTTLQNDTAPAKKSQGGVLSDNTPSVMSYQTTCYEVTDPLLSDSITNTETTIKTTTETTAEKKEKPLSAAPRVGADAPASPAALEEHSVVDDEQVNVEQVDAEQVDPFADVVTFMGDMDGQPAEASKPLWMTMKPIRTQETTWGQLNGWKRTDFPHWHTVDQIVARWGSDTRQTYKPNDKRIQAAMMLGWGLDPGAYAGKRAKQLLGVGEGEWGKHNISPAMTPVEIVAYGIWYRRTFPDQQPVAKPEQVWDYVSRFRDWLQARDACDQITLWKIAESRLAAELGEQDPHASVVVEAPLETI